MKTMLWQEKLKNTVDNVEELLNLLEIPIEFSPVFQNIKSFPLRVPRDFVNRMKKGDPADPLLLQILPKKDETHPVSGFINDPLEEARFNPIPGVLHRYHGRILLTLAGSCPINCRYCFRRHFPYHENPVHPNWQKIIEYIERDPTIEEIIFSGGEPLLIKDKLLKQYIDDCAQIPHLLRLRFHTRMPIVIPDRVTNELIKIIVNNRFNSVIVVHCNHANEIDHHVADAVGKFRQAKITLLNQSVLLKGVNDHVETLLDLSKKLFSVGILPYYLNLLDRVSGSAHFFVTDDEAIILIREITRKLPGYLVPKLVRTIPDLAAKAQILF